MVPSTVPYQLSVPTTCQPAAWAVAEVRPARPLTRVLLKISTSVLPRLITGALGFALVVVDGAAGVGVADGLAWLTVGVAWSVAGWSGSLTT